MSLRLVYGRSGTGKTSFCFKEIGEILGKTENWARVTFYRGKSKLKEVDGNEKGM